MEKTLVIIKPGAVQRELIGKVISRFEQKGLQLCGMKMIWLSDELASKHYAHLADRPFFQRVKNAMTVSPIIVSCWQGLDAVNVVRSMAGTTNGRDAQAGTIRGDFSISIQENIIHASDSVENAKIEMTRFFTKDEIFDYKKSSFDFLYANDEFD